MLKGFLEFEELSNPLKDALQKAGIYEDYQINEVFAAIRHVCKGKVYGSRVNKYFEHISVGDIQMLDELHLRMIDGLDQTHGARILKNLFG